MTAQMIKLISSLDDTSSLELLESISQTLNAVLIDFFTYFLAITTVHSTSKIHVASTSTPSITSSSSSPTTLPYHVRYSINNTTRRPLAGFTGLFVVFGLIGLFANFLRTIFSLVVHPVIHLHAAIVVSSVPFAFLELGVVWSILEENKIGLDAFRAAFDLTKGNRTRSAILMLLHGAWCWAMAVGWPSLMTLFDGLESWQGVAFKVVHQGLVSVGDVMNWVVLVVYYYDCKNSRREKKNSTEVMERDDHEAAGPHLV